NTTNIYIMGKTHDNVVGLILAISSTVFIGSSFIIKKMGLKKAADHGNRAATGGHSYLYEPWWWAGMISMIAGEIANFAAYAFAPAILVTPLGALSIIFSHGQTHMMVYLGICSPTGSITVMGVKAVGIALKLTFEGTNQFVYFETWIFTVVVIGCCLLQINYLNKALDAFSTAVVSPVYYVMFTSFTIVASIITFKEWAKQDSTQIATELCGFVTILSGTFLLHRTKDMGNKPSDASVHSSPEDNNSNTKTPLSNQI
ncbi:Magnesium transporter NIPA2, partial [Glycine soja]